MTNCTYCGELADTLDHVIPISVVSAPARRGRAMHSVGETVPACRDCNSRLGASLYPSLAERAAHLAAALRRKHAKLLDGPNWSEQELRKLGPSVQTHVRSALCQRDEVCRRLAHLDALAWQPDEDTLGDIFPAQPSQRSNLPT